MGLGIYKAFTFDGVASSDYDIYLTGEGVFNAPKRAVNLLEIPGRNGNYALDQGRFQNITVTYKIGIFGEDESTYADKASAFRNWICSKIGYKRLEDEYNPNEYRMALYSGGVEFDTAQLIAGEATISFECKPQRWLTSGETPIEIGAWHDVQTLSGDIVQFSALKTDKVKSLVADIDPIQDLHGYDAPWVGGDGKNKLQTTAQTTTINDVVFTVNADGTIKVNGTASADATLVVYGANASGPDDISISSDSIISLDTTSVRGVVWKSGGGTTFDTGTYNIASGTTLYGLGIRVLSGTHVNNVIVKPMLRLSGTDSTWQPYSNICPIIGWSGVDVDVNGTTISVSWSDDAGTVYGGTVDLVSGELTVTHKLVDLGDYTWVFNNQSGHYYYLFNVADNDIKAPPDNNTKANAICSAYENDTYTHIYNNTTNGTFAIGTGKRLAIYDTYAISQSMTAEQFKTYVTGQTVCYELATPTTYTLTPAQVDLLLGQNTVFADTGDVAVEYGQDPMVLINPTPFEAEPLLAVKGYGDINIGSQPIKIQNQTLGTVQLASQMAVGNAPITQTLDVTSLNNGDTFTVSGAEIYVQYNATDSIQFGLVSTYTFTNCTAQMISDLVSWIGFIITPTSSSFTKGTSATNIFSVSGDIVVEIGGIYSTVSIVLSGTIVYDGDATLTYDITATSVTSTTQTKTVKAPDVFGTSTKTISSTIYIDCDIGEAYSIINDNIVSLNNIVQLPSDLPKLSSGTNTFTYDNTITELKVTPRWWKV